MDSDNKAISRRHFLCLSASLSGVLVPGSGASQVDSKPCPPILSVSGGESHTGGGCAIDAEKDWQLRSTGPGVKWAHNFENDAEVDYWRWVSAYGDDPERRTAKGKLVTRDTSDGITGGGCLKITRRAGSADSGDWWRPMSAVQESGRGVPDIGYEPGRPTIDPPNPEGGSRIAYWGHGNYGPASTGSWEGNEYYLQIRMKLDPRRRDAGTHGGKIMYLTRTERSLTCQELVTTYRNSRQFKLYKCGSPGIDSDLSLFDHVYDQWTTYLYHVVAGDENAPNTTIEVWRALPEERAYTKVYQVYDEPIDYQDAYRKAWNAVLLSIYHNGTNMPEFWQKYDEIIFSTEYIPPPAV